MEWIIDRDPKSQGMYAIKILPHHEIYNFNFAYYDGIGWLLPSQSGKKYAPYRSRPEWSVVDWGKDEEI